MVKVTDKLHNLKIFKLEKELPNRTSPMSKVMVVKKKYPAKQGIL